MTNKLAEGGNFFSSTAFWNAVLSGDRSQEMRNVEIDGHVLRTRVPMLPAPFLDYYQPLTCDAEVHHREQWYVPCVALEVVEVGPGNEPPAWDGPVAPFVSLEGATFESYCASLSSKRFTRDQEKRRKAERELGLRFTRHDPAAIEQAYRWKRAQFPDNTDFTDQNLAMFLAMKDALTVSTLRDRDGRLLSAAIGFIHDGIWGGSIYSHNPDPALAKYSLGTQLFYEMIREAFAHGCREYDFLVGGEPYKWYFATHARLCGPIGKPPLRVRLRRIARRLLRSR